MKITTEQITNLFNPSNRKWTIPIVAVIAVALIGGVVYYGGYLKDLFRGTKAVSSLTVNFNFPDEYTTTSNVTIAGGYITIDPEFVKTGATQFNSVANATDLHSWPSLGITLAAVDADKTIMYSTNNGQTWSSFALSSDIRIKRLAESGGVDGRVFGLGRTAGPNPADEIGAIVHSLLVSGELTQLGYIPLPDTYSVNAGIQRIPGGRLYAGVTPKVPSATSVAIYSADGSLLNSSSFIIPNATSVNDFTQVNNRIYATISKNSSNITDGEALVYYKDSDDASDWIPAVLDVNDNATNHTAARGLVKDAQGYVYVMTNAGYILKSGAVGGTDGSQIFNKIYIPDIGDASMRFAFVDGNTNNIWVPLSSGKLLRSVNGTEFFEVNTGIDLGSAASVIVTDALTLSDGQVLLSGGFWQGGAPYSAAVWFGNAANSQTVSNIWTVPFVNLTSFSTTAVSGNFYYRISNVSGDGPWYYVNLAGDWVFSDDATTKSSSASWIDQHINEFSTQVGSGDLFVQAIFYRSTNPVGFSSPILDSVTIGYDEVLVPHIDSLDPNHGSADGGKSVNIAGKNFGDSASSPLNSVEFSGVVAEVTLWTDTLIIVNAPAGAPNTGVLVTVATSIGVSNGVPYLYDGLGTPEIDSLDPDHGSVDHGNPVQISGKNFGDSVTPQSSVKFGSITTNFTTWTDTLIVATAPAGVPGAEVLVTVATGLGVSNGVPYKYNGLPPTVASIDPLWGPQAGGTLVTITGTGFDTINGATVLFDVSPATNVVVVDSTHITANTPAHTEGSVDVRVTNDDGQFDILSDAFTYLGSGTIISVTDIDPLWGPQAGGTLVTITGTGFDTINGATVLFDVSPATNVVV
ncbi:MAG: IPT/TIG domain-containing protein, partial [Patescibacteria group bacterium]